MKSQLWLLLTPLIFLSACSGKHVKVPEYRGIGNVRSVTLGPLQSSATVDVVFYNPNNFGVQVASGQGDIYVDSSYFGRFELNEKVQVTKRSEFTLPASIKIDMINIIKNQRSIFRKKEATVRIVGTATVKKAGFSRQIPIDYQTIQDLEKFKALIGN